MERGYLRSAVEEDIDLLFQWANETTVRQNSFSSFPITYEDHRKWFKRILSSENDKQYIYMYGKEAIGQVRIAIVGIEAEVSYSICVEKRCMGYGKEMLRLLQEQVSCDFPQVKKIIAKVKSDNIASQKAFLDVGYTKKYEVLELDVDNGMYKGV